MKKLPWSAWQSFAAVSIMRWSVTSANAYRVFITAAARSWEPWTVSLNKIIIEKRQPCIRRLAEGNNTFENQ